MSINPVDLEIIRNALVAAAEEMSVTVWRTSRSSVVREILDYSTCVFDHEGKSVAQAARIPVHLNSMSACLDDLLAGPLPLEQWHEGDVVLTNDPYAGGQHLCDWLTFAPVFVDGERVAIAGIIVHHLDVGGGAPGSYDPRATEIFQEGIRIPPMKVVKAGVRNDEVLALLLRNTREPDKVGGDFSSQLAALAIGAERIRDIARRYGSARLAEASGAIRAQSEAAMRAAIASLPGAGARDAAEPRGVRCSTDCYEFEDFVDDDGIATGPIRIHAVVRVRGDAV
ncbi:MAG: hydantoinase B/oxoprolinase family protein, partial [Gammaproteobacteria bacterium]|nr:hydantoinase B/oxoprolinase family protein [Gammaproteobacteria bacterium]